MGNPDEMPFSFFYNIEDLISPVLDHRKPFVHVTDSQAKTYVLPRSASVPAPSELTPEQEAAMLEALKLKIGADCYDYSVAKLAEMEKQSESSSDADLCENKFVIDMSSLTDDELCYFPQELLANFDMCTQKFMTYTEWNGTQSLSLDDYIQTAGIDQAKCKTACLKDVSKICSKDVDGEEMLSVFFKCPSWEDTQGPAYYCQQQLEAPEKEDQCAGFTQTSPSIMLLL